ncbi:PQQ-dependent sugar dehydrogenase [Desertimonas flava]|uniref:PQQ-dependent sugar dehydrogenase n=1 Tax=Desertimonas flava TaxID=2064846 RepID=UPI0013C42896|nr:PQQ-dependent sugar dehydrogenase [Desertimonas flava]
MIRPCAAAVAVASLVVLGAGVAVSASTPPTDPASSAGSGPPAAATLTPFADVSSPVDLAWRDGDPALYVVQQDGVIQQLVGGAPTPVLDISDLISRGGEQGLLGLAFSPAGDHAYINFTDVEGNTVVAELTVSEDGTAFDRDNMRTVLQIEQPYGNHNGGDLLFGPDGMLYIPTGDGGSGGDPEGRAQNPAELLGKLLRIDPTPSGELGYTVPDDNPFVGVEGTRPEIWSFGLRNPWRVSFDPETGDLWIADVGQGSIEEIDVAPATDGLDAGRGLNFGWNAYEGDAVFDDGIVVEDHHGPIHTYDHATGGCSISGGVRARGDGAGSLVGWYVFADYCSGVVTALEILGEGPAITAGRTVDLATSSSVTAVVSGPDGTVYVLSGEGVLALTPQ